MKIAALRPAQSILARGTDIEALSGMRQQLFNFEGDIDKREGEIRVLWQAVEESMRQLGWPEEGEEAVAQRLPGSLIRLSIDNIIRRHEAFAQALSTTQETLRSREEEVKAVYAEIAALPASAIPVTLACTGKRLKPRSRRPMSTPFQFACPKSNNRSMKWWGSKTASLVS